MGGVVDAGLEEMGSIVCGWVYDDESGEHELGIEPFTRWEEMLDGFYVCCAQIAMELFEEVHVS
ncbi:MAG: rubredoxin [Pseudomonadales bacterium]|nr:rubredoxin [Pseudomonadales bacterium]